MRHMAAYYESAEITAMTPITAVLDTQITTSGNDVRVPPDLTYLGAAFALHNDASFIGAQLQSPSLRALAPYDISTIGQGLVFPNPPVGSLLYANPIQLNAQENLDLAINAGDGGAIVSYGLVELIDGPIKPVSGVPFTVRGTGAAALSAGKWVNTAVAFDVVLPAGNYNVVGFRAEGPALVAARLALIGQSYRPGTPACVSRSAWQDKVYRNGGLGAWGAFNTNQPPTVDCLGVTDTAQSFYFDLIPAGS